MYKCVFRYLLLLVKYFIKLFLNNLEKLKNKNDELPFLTKNNQKSQNKNYQKQLHSSGNRIKSDGVNFELNSSKNSEFNSIKPNNSNKNVKSPLVTVFDSKRHRNNDYQKIIQQTILGFKFFFII